MIPDVPMLRSRAFPEKEVCMKRLYLLALMSCLAAPVALAQEHYTEGPVWECSSYRTKQVSMNT